MVGTSTSLLNTVELDTKGLLKVTDQAVGKLDANPEGQKQKETEDGRLE